MVFIIALCVTSLFLTKSGLMKKLGLLFGLMMPILIQQPSTIGMRVRALSWRSERNGGK